MRIGPMFLSGVPEGLEPNKEYTVVFNATKPTKIIDGEKTFIVFKKDDEQPWELQLEGNSLSSVLAATALKYLEALAIVEPKKV